MKKKITHFLTEENQLACDSNKGGASGLKYTRDPEHYPVTCKRCLKAMAARGYDVFIFTVVKVKVPNVIANNMIEAMDKAENAIDFHHTFQKTFNRGPAEYMEWAEEHSHALVDKKSDEEYENSTWFKGDLKTKMEVK